MGMNNLLRIIIIVITLSISACAPGPKAISTPMASTDTATSLPTNIPPSPIPTVTSTLTPEQVFGEFKESRTYQDALKNYLDYFWLTPDAIQLQMRTLTLSNREYQFIVAIPDQAQLTEAQEKYFDLYQPVPLFYAEQDETTGAWKWDKEPPLRIFADGLGIEVGTLGDRSTIQDENLRKHFNLATLSTINWQDNEPQHGMINMGNPDAIIHELLNNQQEVASGHLINSGEYPDWLREGAYTQEDLEEIVRKHIHDTMTHYQGKIDYWTVVNELHPSDLAHGWYHDYLAEKLGWQKLITIAFDEARKNDPKAILIVNDFSNYYHGDINKGNKLTQDVEVIKLLRQQGMDHLAIGMQMHVNQGRDHIIPTAHQLTQAIKTYRDLGVEVYITEMDVNISPESYNGSVPFSSNDRYLHQAEIYRQILETYFKNTQGQKNQVVITWDFRDADNWLEYVLNYKDPEPLLFDKRGDPKPAYYAFLQVLYSLATNRQ